jgi:hypothetical protein
MTPTVFLDEAPGVVVGEVQPETARPSMRPPLLFRCTACAGLLLAADFPGVDISDLTRHLLLAGHASSGAHHTTDGGAMICAWHASMFGLPSAVAYE